LTHPELVLNQLLSTLGGGDRSILEKDQEGLQAAAEKSVNIAIPLVVVGIGDHVAIAVIVEDGVEERKDEGFKHRALSRGQVGQEGGQMLEALRIRLEHGKV
jgi:hypothetical protein